MENSYSGLERRDMERYALEHWDTLTLIHGKVAYPCRVIDASASGARVEAETRLPDGSVVYLQCPVGGAMPATVVWSSGAEVGLRFEDKWATAAFWYGRMSRKPEQRAA